MKYTRPPDHFYRTLRERVDAYFEQTGQSRKGNAEAWVKVALALVALPQSLLTRQE